MRGRGEGDDAMIERLRAVVSDAARAYAELEKMYAAQDMERARTGELSTAPRDAFENYLSNLAEAAEAALAELAALEAVGLQICPEDWGPDDPEAFYT
jgi:hypothetical protein